MAHARFETLLIEDEALAERRRRLLLSGAMAITVAMGLGLTSYIASKLGIAAVAPPKSFYSVTMEVLDAPPPPTPPPAPAAAAADDRERDAVPDEVVPDEPEVAPTEVVPLDLDRKPRPSLAVPGNAKGPGGGPGLGGPGGVPGGTGNRCLLPPCIGTEVIDTLPPDVLPPKAPQPPIQAPIAAVMAKSVFTPNPDAASLSRTPTGRTHRSPGKTTVSFCIDGDGKTYDVRVRKGFRGDAEVDEICRKTVARWRFSPQRVGGKARSTCSTVTFDIRFE